MTALPWRLWVGMGLTAAAVILLEITATRILSVLLWYHWAFLAISLAMLGIGAPGVWFSLRTPHPAWLPRLLLASALLVPVSVIAALRFAHLFGAYSVLFCMGCLLAPMLSLGGAVCLFLLRAPGRQVAVVYGADLVGACLGALLVIPAMWVLPTPWLAGALGALPLAAAWVVVGRPRPALWAVTAVVALVLAWTPLFQVRSTKQGVVRVPPLYERWTPTARLTVADGMPWREDPETAFLWGAGRKRPPVAVEQYWLEQDGSAGTPIMRFDGDLERHAVLRYDVTAVAYELASPSRVAIIGSGGGRDILTALLAGAGSVDAVEMNRGTIELVSERFGEFSGGVYQLGGVRAVASEGRSFLSATDRSYDVIQISLIDSWAATAAGAYSLSENNLYTVEAYRTYWARLSERGLVSTSRWVGDRQGLELPRLVVLHRALLDGLGVANPASHIAIVQGRAVGTVLLSRRPFSARALARLRSICRERGFDLHHPGPGVNALSSRLKRALGPDPESVADPGLDVSPPTDDRPFFFQVLPVFRPVDLEGARAFGTNAVAVFALQVLMVVLIAVTAVLFVLPVLLAGSVRRAPGFWRGSAYFACIGLAFMIVEIPWLQRFVLYLGHPSHAAAVVLGSVLLGAGLGSLASARLELASARRWGFAVAGLVAVCNAALGSLFVATLGWALSARILASAALLVPVGFVLGTCFPVGMRCFGDANKAWFWAINGAFGVLASVLSLALSMTFGFTNVVWAGAALYLGAWLLMRRALADSPAPVG